MSWFERPPRILMGFVLLWLVVFLWLFSDAGVPFPSWVGMSAASLALGLAWVVRLAIAFANQKPELRLVRPQLRYWVTIPAILAGAVVLGLSLLPLSVRVYLSADALTHSAPFAAPEKHWIGLFLVQDSSRFDNERRFLTNECGLVDSCGVVFSPDGPPPRRGEDSFRHLYGPWWHWYQSW
jgi:hypothetical protein